ncbi:MAG TPA: hypothetical protein VNM15_01440, partial [Candidatus Binatia bacterium]|nr:hypothetical protein [Candidatus Binatia bacterium]
LESVRSPTLLIVGGFDDVVIELNRQAYKKLRVEKRLAIVPGATHLFEEPGALQEVARLAADWFKEHLAANRSQESGLQREQKPKRAAQPSTPSPGKKSDSQP